VLEVLAPVGVADNLQFQRATGWTRAKVELRLKKMEEAAPGLPPIIERLDHSLPRPGRRGHPPKVYRLRESGAALLRANGHPDAWPCGRKDDTDIMHALCILDVYLAAQQAGLVLEAEREMRFGDDRVLRPDMVITQPDNQKILFEIEQLAYAENLRRILKSLHNKVAFFNSEQGQQVPSTVRVLFNLTRGRDWNNTLKVWRRAIAIKTEQTHAALPFRLLAMPLTEFLARPAWQFDADDRRWTDLTAAAQPDNASPQPGGKTRRNSALSVMAPQDMVRRSTHDDVLILGALWQWFTESAGRQQGKQIRPDPEFWKLVRLIYGASHDSEASLLERAALPHTSLFLLGRYLKMHPYLRGALVSAVRRGGHAMRWNPTTILHRMQTVIDAFLGYHGWCSDGSLKAWSGTRDWDSDGSRAFSVFVHITSGELLMTERNGVVPGQDEIRRTEEALAWVLYALFAYAPDIGLDYPAFW
jgi:hypothetical protein